ncbi:SIS domain-containing protein, partial [Candidatus Kaiserbacteria bacterium]|nr:SIS domain-containing protein [Candidatus Kaiserbacteria bacterium]
QLLPEVRAVHIVACGTSCYAGATAKRWFTKFGIPVEVFIASEYRYDDVLVPSGTLFVAISQSGETTDTLEAMLKARGENYLALLAICNTPDSAIVRESDHTFITLAGREQAVASTKAFVTQLVALRLLTDALGHLKEPVDDVAPQRLPSVIEDILACNNKIHTVAESYGTVRDAFFLGRRGMVPIAAEGALKLKEVSYVHAEAYPAGEMKHGPIALVDNDFLCVFIVMKDGLEEKVVSSMEEVLARHSHVLAFAEDGVELPEHEKLQVIRLGKLSELSAPFAAVTALQLFAYHMATLRGTDVDQPKNLAKSVTVE